jgi:hypothetical protein
MRGAKRGLDRYFRLSADLDQGVVGWHIAGSFQRRQSEIGLPDLSSQKIGPRLGRGPGCLGFSRALMREFFWRPAACV